MAPRLLVECVRKVHAGEKWLEKHSVARAMDRMVKRENEIQRLSRLLTPRELEIVRLAAEGLRNREIADRLTITEGTVKIHLHNIYEKLGVTGRPQLILSPPVRASSERRHPVRLPPGVREVAIWLWICRLFSLAIPVDRYVSRGRALF